MARVGFLGLGIMGAPMAEAVIDAGHEVAVWSHNNKKAEAFAKDSGAVFAKTPADVGRASRYMFLCVGNTAMSKHTILGESGLASTAATGSVIVDCSTVSPLVSEVISKELSQKQIQFLDAPCTGSKAGAVGRTLTFMVGGERSVFDEMQPYFQAMGKMIYYCGGAGMGLRAKVTQNLILGNVLQAFNEGFVLSTKAGIDPELMLDIINNSAARSGVIAAKAPAVFKRDFTPTFSVRWLEKDLGLSLELAAELGVPLPVTAVSQQMLRMAMAKGYADEDICGSIRVLEDVTGCKVASSK